MDISILTVNYNTADMIGRCIRSVLSQSGVKHEMIVVDNASEDSSIKVLQEYNDRIKLIKSSKNLGFGKANNLAAQSAQGQYLFLLNPDAILHRKGDLKRMLEFMNDNSRYGLVGTKIVNFDGHDETPPKLHHSGERFLHYPFKNLPGKIAWVIGASMIIPKFIYDSVNGFDEDFFLYGEDEDLCLRIRQAGYEIGYLPDVKVRHFDGGSERDVSEYDITIKKQKASYLFYRKYYSEADAKYLVKLETKRSHRHMLINKMRLLLKLKPSLARYERYKAIYESGKEFLSK